VEGLERLVVLDNLTDAGSRGNLIGPDHDPRFCFVQGDIADHDLLARLLHEHQITGVFNLAAETRVDRALDRLADFVHSNVAGTAVLLDACLDARIPLLQCSTDEVYGSVSPPDRFTENSVLNPSSPYSATKASADLLCLAAAKTFRQDVLVTRCSNNYGPRQHSANLIPALVGAALRDEPLPLSGDGMDIRDWIHVDDHCRGLLAAFGRGYRGGVYLFGGQCERTNLGIARDVLKILGKPETLIGFVPDRPMPDRRNAIDVSKAHAFFGWRPQKKFKTVFPSVVRELAANFHAA
jgi:dTDP-glucose 4,6-dehydratase